MQNGLYVAVSAQVALQRRLETIADNVANMNTVGYRATGVSFEKEMGRPATRGSTTSRPARTMWTDARGDW
jgi:flagellar basal-body rod protein FlgF